MKRLVCVGTLLLTAICAIAGRADASVLAPCGDFQGGPPTGPACRLTIEAHSPDSTEVAAAADRAIALGGAVLRVVDGLAIVDVDSTDFGEIRSEVPAGYALTATPLNLPYSIDDEPGYGRIVSQAVERTNAAAWHRDGTTGDGMVVGVIDYFDVASFWNTDEHGPQPVVGRTAICRYFGEDCSAEFFDQVDLGGERHGVAVVEVVKDMAPDAEVIIGQASTLSDYYDVVDMFAANGVTVITRSLGSRYDGPGDGRGDLDAVAEYAVERGMLWVNSAGNNARGKYYRSEVRLDGDLMVFENGSTWLNFAAGASLGGVRWYTDWDKPPAERTDYDIELYRGDQLIASSTLDQTTGVPPLELISNYFAPEGQQLRLRIRYVDGPRPSDTDPDIIEVLDYDEGFTGVSDTEYAASTSIVDSADPGVMAVGAIDPPTGDQIAPYSSHGPTNDGRISPDLTATAGNSNSLFGSFSGTSAAAPVVAGGAALYRQVHPGPTAPEVGERLRELAIDRGDPGADNVFGYGEFRLPATDEPDDPPTTPPPPPAPTVYSRFVEVTPQRISDTRVGARVAGGTVRQVDLGMVPDRGVAIAANIAMVDAAAPGFVQVFPTSGAEVGDYSTLNVDAAGQTRSNFSIVPIGRDGTISVYSSTDADVVIDLLGYYEVAGGLVAAGRFEPLGRARRALDTRNTDGPLASGSTRLVPLPETVDPGAAGALVVTVTGIDATAPGWVQIHPAADTEVVGRTSTINLAPGEAVANTAIVPIDASGVAISGRFADGGSAEVVVDVVGYLTAGGTERSESGLFVPIRPGRAFDSRQDQGGPGSLVDGEVVTVNANDAPGVDVPAGASAVVWNAAVVDAHRPGFVRAWKPGSREPDTSAINWTTQHETRAGSTISGVDDGQTLFRVDDGPVNAPGRAADLIVDVFGYLTG